jgi:hypothetical protein
MQFQISDAWHCVSVLEVFVTKQHSPIMFGMTTPA